MDGCDVGFSRSESIAFAITFDVLIGYAFIRAVRKPAPFILRASKKKPVV